MSNNYPKKFTFRMSEKHDWRLRFLSEEDKISMSSFLRKIILCGYDHYLKSDQNSAKNYSQLGSGITKMCLFFDEDPSIHFKTLCGNQDEEKKNIPEKFSKEFTFRMSYQDYEILRLLSEHYGRSMSSLLRDYIWCASDAYYGSLLNDEIKYARRQAFLGNPYEMEGFW